MLIGRQNEVAALRAAAEDGCRTIALAGPPGCGKTRLALEFASDAGAFVDLSGSDSTQAAALKVASALSVVWEDASDVESLFATIGRRDPATVVWDATDKLPDEELAGLLSMWRKHCSDHFLVVTARAPVPDVDRRIDVPVLKHADAVELFVQRSGTAGDPDAIAELVERLDRLPLAIELAAARTTLMEPPDILARLDDRFALLAERRRGRVLEHAIAWAWDTLTDAEQSALIQMSVFAGSFTLDDAQAIVELPEGEGTWVVDVVAALVEGSMLRRASSNDAARFAHFETVLAYARHRPGAEAIVASATLRHASHFEGLMVDAASELLSDAAGAVARVQAGLVEIGAAFDRCLETSPARAAAIAVSVTPFLLRSAAGAVLGRFLDSALGAEEIDAASRGALAFARGELRVGAGKLDVAADDFSDAISAARNGSRPDIIARATFRLGDVERRRGRAREALMMLGQAIEVGDPHDNELQRVVTAHLACCYVDLGENDQARRVLVELQQQAIAQDSRVEAEVLKRMAYSQFYLENYGEQHRLGLAALDHARRAADRRLEALCVHGLGDSALQLGLHDEAREHYEAALPIHRELGDVHYVAVLLGNLGTLHHLSERPELASTSYREALELHRRTGARPYEAVVSFALGVLEAERGHDDEALHHYSSALEIYEELELHEDVGATHMARAWILVERGERSEAVLQLRQAEAAFHRSEATAWSAIASVAAEALQGTVSSLDNARAVVAQRGGETERELLDLAAAFAGPPPGEVVEPTASLHVRAMRRAVTAPRPVEDAGSNFPRRLLVSSAGEWFEFGGDRIDLRRRKSLRLLLRELVRRQTDAVSDDLGVYEAFEIGWPGEVAGAEASADRVYWAIGTLRKLGLGELLVTTDDGYHLDPALVIDWA